MAVTLKDIAAVANVSIGTVERALKNKGRINPEVAERIREIAREMDYRPNRIASGLVNRSKQYKIAIVIHTLNDFMEDVLKGIRRAGKDIKDYGISLQEYIGNSYEARDQIALIDQAIQEGAAAMVLIPIHDPIVEEKIRQLTKEGFPVVFLINYLSDISVFSAIHCDYYRSGRVAASLLNRLGTQGGEAVTILPSMHMLGNQKRQEGIRDYFLGEGRRLELVASYELTGHEEEDVEAIRQVLSSHPGARHVIYNGDTGVYLKALSSMPAQGEYVSVVFDTSPDSERALLGGQIDAIISQSQTRQGYQAVDALFQYFVSQKRPEKERLMKSEILIRESLEETGEG